VTEERTSVGAAPTGAAAVDLPKGVGGALVRYRVMAYVTGTLLILLVFVAMPIKYLGHNDTPVAIIGQVHGYLYIVYLLAAADLARRVRFSLTRMVAMFLAGVVPTLAFFCERRATGWVKERVSG
jgi:integral membrane protein